MTIETQLNYLSHFVCISYIYKCYACAVVLCARPDHASAAHFRATHIFAFQLELNKRWQMRVQHNTLSAYHHQINDICPTPNAHGQLIYSDDVWRAVMPDIACMRDCMMMSATREGWMTHCWRLAVCIFSPFIDICPTQSHQIQLKQRREINWWIGVQFKYPKNFFGFVLYLRMSLIVCSS